MAKTRTIFVCQQCGAQQARWMGKCPDCDTWDSLVEQAEARPGGRGGTRESGSAGARPVRLRDVPTGGFQRLPVYAEELARVLGGGLVPGSVVLIGGDPGVGKSTLLTQVAAHFAATVGPALYVSAEESAQQIKLRAERLELLGDELFVYSETSLDTILSQIRQSRPGMVIVDSIQTVYLEDLSSAAGSVSQVREGALRLMQLAKELGVPIFLVAT